MQKIILACLLCFFGAVASAQDTSDARKKGDFSPQEFEACLEEYVVKEASLTKAETQKFLPIYREMRQKQVAAMDAERSARLKKPSTEKECEEAIKAHDNTEIQLKKIVQTYHNKMLEVISASKVMKVTMAENKFHREKFRQMHDKRQPPASKK